MSKPGRNEPCPCGSGKKHKRCCGKTLTSRERYKAAAHAMLSGVSYDLDKKDREPKHLRHGINTALCDQAGLVKLLIEKGVITREEYMKSIADTMEMEVDSYEKRLQAQYGEDTTITLA